MLIGHEIDAAALLDGDEPGRKEGKKLADKLLAGHDRRIFFIGDFVEKTSAELEDIFPEEEYLSVVKESYPEARLDFTAEERAIEGIVDRIQALFLRHNLGPFEKWKPAAVLRDRIIGSPAIVPKPTLDLIERVFQAINSALAPEITQKKKSTEVSARA